MTIFKLNFIVNCGLIEKNKAGLIPELLAKNPFGTCTAFFDDSANAKLGEQELQPKTLQEIISSKKQWHLTLLNHSDSNPLSVVMLQKSHGAMLSITAGDDQLNRDYERFLAYARFCVEALPDVSGGYIEDVDFDIVGAYHDYSIEQPPACFTTHLRWVHFLGPRLYSLYLTKEDLLNTPAHKIEQLEQGIIEVMNYDNPFDCGSAATLKKMIVITEYLNAKDQFMKNFEM